MNIQEAPVKAPPVSYFMMVFSIQDTFSRSRRMSRRPSSAAFSRGAV